MYPRYDLPPPDQPQQHLIHAQGTQQCTPDSKCPTQHQSGTGHHMPRVHNCAHSTQLAFTHNTKTAPNPHRGCTPPHPRQRIPCIAPPNTRQPPLKAHHCALSTAHSSACVTSPQTPTQGAQSCTLDMTYHHPTSINGTHPAPKVHVSTPPKANSATHATTTHANPTESTQPCTLNSKCNR